MKLHERGSLFWWIIVGGMVFGWFGSDDDTKKTAVDTAKLATSTVVEKVEKFADEAVEEASSSTDNNIEFGDGTASYGDGTASYLETPRADIARLKDAITSAIYESAVAEIVAGNEVTLKTIWGDMNSKLQDAEITTTSFVADFLDDNTAIVVIGGEKLVINFDAEVGMVRNIEKF